MVIAQKYNDRPTFNFMNKKHFPVRAGGFMFYRWDKNKLYFLMIKKSGKYEDFGGKSDIEDKCIEDMVSREADEESNGIFNKNIVKNLILDQNCVYLKPSKYVLYMCKTYQNYEVEKFGDKEFYENVNRTVEWVPYSKLNKKHIHIRLINKFFFRKINYIFKNKI